MQFSKADICAESPESLVNMYRVWINPTKWEV